MPGPGMGRGESEVQKKNMAAAGAVLAAAFGAGMGGLPVFAENTPGVPPDATGYYQPLVPGYVLQPTAAFSRTAAPSYVMPGYVGRFGGIYRPYLNLPSVMQPIATPAVIKTVAEQSDRSEHNRFRIASGQRVTFHKSKVVGVVVRVRNRPHGEGD